jgi:hypothetical protein
MRSKLIDDPVHDAGAGSQKTFALIFKTEDQAMSELKAFAEQQHLAASHFAAIGAFKDLTLGYFDWEKKDYVKIPVHEQVEVLSLVGDITIIGHLISTVTPWVTALSTRSASQFASRIHPWLAEWPIEPGLFVP